MLVQALAKDDRDDQAIEAATELRRRRGRAVAGVAQRRGRGAASAASQGPAQVGVGASLAAAKQSRRARRRWCAPVGPTAALVTERVARRRSRSCCTRTRARRWPTVALPPGGDVLLVVGPEGGIAPDELEAFTGAGARAVRLGDTVLRSSSAGPAALAVLSAAGRWR